MANTLKTTTRNERQATYDALSTINDGIKTHSDLPYDAAHGGWEVLSGNSRDENADRYGRTIIKLKIGDKYYHVPADTVRGGTPQPPRIIRALPSTVRIDNAFFHVLEVEATAGITAGIEWHWTWNGIAHGAPGFPAFATTSVVLTGSGRHQTSRAYLTIAAGQPYNVLVGSVVAVGATNIATPVTQVSAGYTTLRVKLPQPIMSAGQSFSVTRTGNNNLALGHTFNTTVTVPYFDRNIHALNVRVIVDAYSNGSIDADTGVSTIGGMSGNLSGVEGAGNFFPWMIHVASIANEGAPNATLSISVSAWGGANAGPSNQIHKTDLVVTVDGDVSGPAVSFLLNYTYNDDPKKKKTFFFF